MDPLKIEDILVETRKLGIDDKISKIILGSLFSCDKKEIGPIVASILINTVMPRLEKEGTHISEIEIYHYGMTYLIHDCAVGVHIGVLQSHHVRKILNDCWYTYVAYGLVQYLTETKLLNEVSGGDLDAIIDKVIAANQKACDEVRMGKDKAVGALVGQIIKQHKTDPAAVKALLFEKIRGN